MQPRSVVLLQSDPRIAKSLVSLLSNSFPTVHQAHSIGELQTSIAKHRADVAILDIEAASLSDVERLCHDFPEASIVCTHRLADEEMWTAALNAGACDVCPSSDTQSILRAAVTNAVVAKSAAA